MSISLPKVYDPQGEADIYAQREAAWAFAPTMHTTAKKTAKKTAAPTFVMPLPPPNVTWILHIGHALMLAVEDTMVRYHRMNGHNTLWIPGTDHAWIATQVVVERKLMEEEKKTKHELGRQHFLARVWKRVAYSRSTIINQTKRIWASLDWSREQFTLSEGLSRAVRQAFVTLYDKERIYKSAYMVNWSPGAQTVLSDIEVDYQETEGKMYYVRYFIEGKGDSITVATTRPETMFADVAIAVHPKDRRYKKRIGRNVLIPLVNRPIPVIADEKVDFEFGTWALKITPTHDENDYQIALRHELPLDNFAFDMSCIYTSLAGEHLEGKDVYEFFPNLIQLLTEIGNLEKLEDYTHSVPHCERTGCRVQPMLSQQWFMDVAPAADRIIHELAEEHVDVHPQRYTKTFTSWLENLRPRCISRQLWWWHRIPVWYDQAGNKYAWNDANVINEKSGKHVVLAQIIFNLIADSRLTHTFHIEELVELLLQSALPERTGRVFESYLQIYQQHYVKQKKRLKEIQALHDILSVVSADATGPEIVKAGNKLIDILEATCNIVARGDKYEFVYYTSDGEPVQLTQEEDVLDTWFSSALWPFSILWWPEETEDLATYYPMSVLETGYDIIFFRVIRMMIMGIELTDQMPFRHVYLHGLVKDEQGQKVSKSKGNALDPLKLIDTYGADALRWALLQGNTPGTDIKFSEQRVEYMSRFMNKLRNATRFVASRVWGSDTEQSADSTATTASTDEVRISYTALQEDLQDNLDQLNPYDIRMLWKVQTVVEQVTKYNSKFMLGEALQETIQLTRHDFCDWYIEITKREQSPYTFKVMLYTLLTTLKLLHPVMPYISEKLWWLLRIEGMLINATWPRPVFAIDSDYKINLLMDMISQRRNLRTQATDKPHEKVILYVQGNLQVQELVQEHASLIEHIVNVESIEYVDARDEMPAEVITALILDITIGVKWIKELNRKERLQELEKMIKEEEAFLQRLRSMLASSSFTLNAPPEVVDEKKTKMQEVKQKITQLTLEVNKLKMMHK